MHESFVKYYRNLSTFDSGMRQKLTSVWAANQPDISAIVASAQLCVALDGRNETARKYGWYLAACSERKTAACQTFPCYESQW
jgi:hypothetical protein